MKKSNRKGFILAETIAVSTIVMTSLVILYSQFVSINNSYNRSFSYNNVNNLYLVKNIRDYLSEENLNKLISSMEESNSLYIDITSCPNEYCYDNWSTYWLYSWSFIASFCYEYQI